MRLKLPLYSIPLLALTALALCRPQRSSDTSALQQQVLDDAATVLATLQDQTPKDIRALQALASNGIFGGNARLTSENSLLIAILGRVPQLAQELSAALKQTSTPAPVATATATPAPNSIPTPTPTPVTPQGQDPATLKKQCDPLQSLVTRFTAFKTIAKTLARNTDGGASYFYTASKSIQVSSDCQGNPSDICKSFNDLEAEFQDIGNQVLQEVKDTRKPNQDKLGYEVSLNKIAAVIERRTDPLLASINKIRTSLQCSK